jgi:CBS domain-containing protein
MSGRRIKDVMTADPVVVPSTAPVGTVAALMREHDIGAVLVADETTTGLVTDRDLVVRVLAEDDGPDTAVGAALTPSPLCLRPEDSVEAAIETMRMHAVRRIPVVEDGRPVGIVSLGDLAEDRDPDSVLGSISAAGPNH